MLVKAEKEEIPSKATTTSTPPVSATFLHDLNVFVTKIETTLQLMAGSYNRVSSTVEALTELTMSLALSEEIATPLALPSNVPGASTGFHALVETLPFTPIAEVATSAPDPPQLPTLTICFISFLFLN